MSAQKAHSDNKDDNYVFVQTIYCEHEGCLLELRGPWFNYRLAVIPPFMSKVPGDLKLIDPQVDQAIQVPTRLL